MTKVQAGPVVAERKQFQAMAAELRDLQDSSKKNADALMARVEATGLDPAGLRRFVSWKRKDETKRAQQDAIDQQCRYLAGERATPAELPVGCELAQAINLYRRNMTVRQVAVELHISSGKAGKLRQLARMFGVHVHDSVDSETPHDADTGEVLPGSAPVAASEKGGSLTFAEADSAPSATESCGGVEGHTSEASQDVATKALPETVALGQHLDTGVFPAPEMARRIATYGEKSPAGIKPGPQDTHQPALQGDTEKNHAEAADGGRGDARVVEVEPVGALLAADEGRADDAALAKQVACQTDPKWGEKLRTDAMGAKASQPEPVQPITDEAAMTAMEAARKRFMAIR